MLAGKSLELREMLRPYDLSNSRRIPPRRDDPGSNVRGISARIAAVDRGYPNILMPG
jgi:hypothetical protein